MVWPPLEARTQPHLCEIARTRNFWKEQRSTEKEKRWRDNINGDMKKYQLTEDMALDRRSWMTQIMAGAQGDGQGALQSKKEFKKSELTMEVGG